MTNTSLNTNGKCPTASDRLNSSVRKGAMSVAINLLQHWIGTGSGSDAELPSSSFMIPATTSLTEIAKSDGRGTPGLAAVNVGSGASAVPDLIAANLSTTSTNVLRTRKGLRNSCNSWLLQQLLRAVAACYFLFVFARWRHYW